MFDVSASWYKGFLGCFQGESGAETPSSTKDITQSIENALGAFDFLEAEYYHDGYGSAS